MQIHSSALADHLDVPHFVDFLVSALNAEQVSLREAMAGRASIKRPLTVTRFYLKHLKTFCVRRVVSLDLICIVLSLDL